jgi:hypothetical protein
MDNNKYSFEQITIIINAIYKYVINNKIEINIIFPFLLLIFIYSCSREELKKNDVIPAKKEAISAINEAGQFNYEDPNTYLLAIGDNIIEWNGCESVEIDLFKKELKKNNIIQKTKFDYQIKKGFFTQKNNVEYIFVIQCVDSNSGHVCNFGEMSTIYMFNRKLDIMKGPVCYSNFYKIKEITDIDNNGLNEIIVDIGGFTQMGYFEGYLSIFSNNLDSAIFNIKDYDAATGDFVDEKYESETKYKIENGLLTLFTTKITFFYDNKDERRDIDTNIIIHKYRLKDNVFYHVAGKLNFLLEQNR